MAQNFTFFDQNLDFVLGKKFDLRDVNDPDELNGDEPGEDADSLASGDIDFEDDEELDYLHRKLKKKSSRKFLGALAKPSKSLLN